MNATGFAVILPWVHLPKAVLIGGFKMTPIQIDELTDAVGGEMTSRFRDAIRMHVDQRGQPIEACTIVLRPRHPVKWDIPVKLHGRAFRATQLLALACLSEQRFMEGHFTPHMNAVMFSAIALPLRAGDDRLTLKYRRRGGSMFNGGLHFADTVFQQPFQVYGTECVVPNVKLARGIERANRAKAEIAERILASLDFFLLANAESVELSWESCCMLSAMAFEQLLDRTGAQPLAERFSRIWQCSPSIALRDAKRVKPDKKPDWVNEQLGWPVHRKWMKELYELRSSQVHKGPREKFSVNWMPWQHSVAAPFAYAMTIKILLAEAGFLTLSRSDEVARDVFDRLLDCHWGSDTQPAEWSEILFDEECSRQRHDDIRAVFEQAKRRGLFSVSS